MSLSSSSSSSWSSSSSSSSASEPPPSLSDSALRAIMAIHAPARPSPLVPELTTSAADDELPLWMALEAALGCTIAAPFYAVAWPGAQVVARAILDGVIDVVGKRVVEVGCGSGLASLAAARAGASHVTATDIDPIALQLVRCSAADNGVVMDTAIVDIVDSAAVAGVVAGADVIIAADVVYNAALGSALASIIDAHPDVVVADSGRPFFDARGLPLILTRTVVVPFAVEGTRTREVCVYQGPEKGRFGPFSGP
jgi:predicted nicotinamide N-methyase